MLRGSSPLHRCALVALLGCANAQQGARLPDLTASTGAADAARPSTCSLWGLPERRGALDLPAIDEASGLVASRRNQGLFWLVEDSGNDASVFGITGAGATLAILRLTGVANVDMEAIAVAPCDAETCVYVADIGDNRAQRADVAIHRFSEPEIRGGSDREQSIEVESRTCTYADGARNAEGFAITRAGQMLIVSKRGDGKAELLVATWPRVGERCEFVGVGMISTGNGDEAEPAMATAADISPDGDRLLVRTYLHLWEFVLPDGDPARVQADSRVEITAALEGQGEAVAYAADGLSIWQVSEGSGSPIHRIGCALRAP